jgi:tetratricopeptide (TPR) repeat protein
MAYSEAVRELSIYAGDPLGRAEALIAAEPECVMAHVLKAWLNLLGTDPLGVAPARQALDAARKLPANSREKGHLAAIAHLVEGRFHAASRAIEDVTLEHPRDLLGLIAGHQIDFLTGNSRMLRDRISRVRPAWSKSLPGYHSVLGMHAFGLEEMANYGKAEAAGREALELERSDGWARHAVAHVLEMQGRHDEGIAFMEEDIPSWTEGSFFAVHNWWHLALYHLERGDMAAVMKLLDSAILNPAQPQMFDLVDASAMLWRLHLRGVALESRWQGLAAQYQKLWKPGFYAFNDLHALMAFAGAGRQDLVQETIAAQRQAVVSPGDNAVFADDVGRPLMLAFAAFTEGRYQDAIAGMRAVRGIASRFGGSHAQRDVIDLTLIEAAIRSGNMPLAGALAAERLAAKHDSPLAALFARRANLRMAA